MPQNSVWAIVQARDGYLWFTTSEGLVRFDGIRFRVFNSVNTPEITDNVFSPYCLTEDRNGGLWAGTRAGAVRYHDGVFTAYTSKNGLPGNTVLRIDEDLNGIIWIFTDHGLARWSNGQVIPMGPEAGLPLDYFSVPKNVGVDAFFFGLWRFTPAGWQRFAYGKWSTLALPPHMTDPAKLRIDSIVEDSERRLWYTVFDRPGECYRVIDGHLTVFKGLPFGSFVCFQDRQGYLWVKDHEGHASLWKDGQLSPLKGFSTPSVFRALVDHEGGVWLGTKNEGLFHLRRQMVSVYRPQAGPGLNDIHALIRDHAGDLWLGSSGLSKFSKGKFTNFYRPGRPWETSNLIWTLYEDRDKTIWAGSWDGIARFRGGRLREEKRLSFDIKGRVNAIYRDSHGDLWFGGEQGLYRVREGAVTRYTKQNGLTGDRVNQIFEDHKHTLWIGTSGGLCQLSKEALVSTGPERDVGQVTSMYEDSTGTLWIGTEEGGLVRYLNGKFTRYTTEQGLYNNSVSGILEDDLGFLWMSSRFGIFCARKQQLNDFASGTVSSITSTHFGKSDGLLDLDCTGGGQSAQLKASDGRLWFATREGIAVVNPKARRLNASPPAVTIEECLLDGHFTLCRDGLHISAGQHNLEIHYTGTSFINPDQMRFEYRLQGLDADWVRPGARRTAFYSHIPPGQYRFIVNAGNSDGVWNRAGESIPVVVLGPLYQTWWFATLACLGLGALVWFIWAGRVAQFKRIQATQQAFARQLIALQESERKRIAAELHDSLGQRLVVIKNLALMFLHTAERVPGINDCFNQIEEISAESSTAIGEVKEISYNLRPYQLDRIGLTKAIEALAKTAAAASPIVFTAVIDDIDQFFPQESEINFYRIVQEGLNNVLKHSHASQSSISIQRDTDQLQLIIHDNGLGFSPGSTHTGPRSGGFGLGGFGLVGISERAQLLGGSANIQSSPGEGTTITIKITTGPFPYGR